MNNQCGPKSRGKSFLGSRVKYGLYLKRFGQNFKCFFKGDGQKIARECQLDNFAEYGRSDSRYLFLGFETGFRFRESDFKNNL